MEKFWQLILIAFIYSILGWILEVTVSFIRYKKFVNRGFLIGPICPIYGIALTILELYLSKYKNDLFLIFIMSTVICSLVEYFFSYLMEKIFKNRWWDYTKMKYNINGRICLEYAIPLGICACIFLCIIYPLSFYILNKINIQIIKYISIILIIISIIDLIISFNIIINLKHISSNIRSDSTQKITKKVKKILKKKTYFYRRLLLSFPNMKVMNKLSIIKDKIKEKKKH